jgi:pentatricopeptide repeat protein
MQIMAAANSGNFATCFQIAAKMKAAGITPDISTYNALMSAAAQDANTLFSWAVLDDMLLVGIQPTTTTFTHLMDVIMAPFHFQVSLLIGISRRNVDNLLGICGMHGTK